MAGRVHDKAFNRGARERGAKGTEGHYNGHMKKERGRRGESRIKGREGAKSFGGGGRGRPLQ